MIALPTIMSKVNFQLAYDGPGLRSGAMDVNQLAPALLATADLLREANRQLNGEKADVSIKVRSDFKKGSFEVALIFDQNLIEHAKALMFPTSIVGATALMTFLFGTESGKKGVSGAVESVLDLWKRLKGEKPKSAIEDASKGITIIVMGNGNQINTNPQVAKLYGDSIIRSAIGGTLGPIGNSGIDSLVIRRGDKKVNEVKESDLPESLGPGTSLTTSGRSDRTENIREVMLRVIRANFEKGKWGFSDGSASFSADIEDEVFLKQLDDHEIGFFKGDVLRVRLKTVQVVATDQDFKTQYVIEQVIEHRHAPRQQELPGAKAPRRKLLLD